MGKRQRDRRKKRKKERKEKKRKKKKKRKKEKKKLERRNPNFHRMMKNDEKKMFSDFLGVFLEIKFRWNKCAEFWKILKKLFFSGKKSNFKFQNRGYFGKKKCSAKFLKLRS